MGVELYNYKARIREAFNLFDKDKSGKISVKELKKIIKQELGQSETDLWTSIVEDVDQNGDGELDFREFQEVMSRVKATSTPS